MKNSITLLWTLLHLAHGLHIKSKPDPQLRRFTLTIRAPCTNKTPSHPARLHSSTSTLKPHIGHPPTQTSVKATKPHPRSGFSLPQANSFIPTSSPTLTTPTTSNMAKATITTIRTRTASKKKQDLAADKLQKQVALKKKKRELKKKQRAAEK